MPIKSGLLFIVRRLRSHGAALACLVVGFAAADLTFVFADALLLRPPPGIARPEQLVRFYFMYAAIGQPTSANSATSLPVYDALRGATRSFSGVATIGERPAFAILGDASRWVSTGLASNNYFAVLRAAAPAVGRFFATSDGRTDNSEIVLTYRFWREAFGGDRGTIGQPLRFSDGSSGTIVGVAPEQFRGVGDEQVDLWLTMPARLPPDLDDPHSYWLTVIGRLHDAVRREQAEQEARSIFERLDFLRVYATPPPRIVVGSVITARGPEGGVTRTVAFCSIAIVGILVLAVIGNFVNLGLLRVIHVRRSLATRLALGAPASAVGRLILAEQMVLALTACCIAVALIELMLIWTMGGDSIPYLGNILPDPNSARSLGFAVVLTAAIGSVGGVVPALAANRIAAREAMGSASTASPRSAATRSVLVAAQVALCVGLVVCGLIVGRSFRHIRDTRIGIDTDRVVAVTFDEAVQGANLDRIVGLQSLLRRLPGVEAVSEANFAPFLFATEVLVIVPGRPTLMRPDHATAAFNRVTADFFRSMGTRIVAGRPFVSAEESNGARVAIINATLARAGWPPGNAVGQCIMLGSDSTCTTVVGVAEDARRFSVVHEDVGMQVYVPLTAGRGWYNRRVVFARTSQDPGIALASVRRFLRRQVPDLHGNARLLADIVKPQLRPWLLALRLFGFSGAVVLIITGIGLYGTLAIAEAQRRPEMAIRIALGARTQDILRAVGGRAARDTAIGLAVGLLAAAFASRALQSLAYDLTPADVGIVAASCVLLVGVLCVAVLNPVRQVLRLDLAPLMRAD